MCVCVCVCVCVHIYIYIYIYTAIASWHVAHVKETERTNEATAHTTDGGKFLGK